MARKGSNNPTAKGVSDLDKDIGLRIAEHRLSQGLTRQDLAAKLQITHQQLQKYERGTNRVSASRLADIAVILGIPVVTFFEGGKYAPQPVPRQRLCIEIMRDFSAIKREDQQEAIRQLVRVLAHKGK